MLVLKRRVLSPTHPPSVLLEFLSGPGAAGSFLEFRLLSGPDDALGAMGVCVVTVVNAGGGT